MCNIRSYVIILSCRIGNILTGSQRNDCTIAHTLNLHWHNLLDTYVCCMSVLLLPEAVPRSVGIVVVWSVCNV